MRNLTRADLSALYSNYALYRDIECNGWAKMSVQDFLKKYGVNGYAG